MTPEQMTAKIRSQGEEIEALRTTRNTLTQRLSVARADAVNAETTVSRQTAQIVAAQATNTDLTKQRDDALGQVSLLTSQLATANAKITDLEAQRPVPKPMVMAPGIYIDGGPAGVAEFETWLGRSVSPVHQFVNFDSRPSGWGNYSDRMLFSVDGLNGSGGSNPKWTMADVAAGLHNEAITAFAQALVDGGFGSAKIRLFWEYNGHWFSWSLSKTDAGTFRRAFRAIVAAMRAATGQAFTFEWNTAIGTPLDVSAYPGIDVVDYHGGDIYAGYGGTSIATATFTTKAQRDSAVAPWVVFAVQCGKPVAVSEWGLWFKDDPDFVAEMFARFASWDLAYHVYFDRNGHDDIEHRLSVLTGSGAEFKEQAHA